MHRFVPLITFYPSQVYLTKSLLDPFLVGSMFSPIQKFRGSDEQIASEGSCTSKNMSHRNILISPALPSATQTMACYTEPYRQLLPCVVLALRLSLFCLNPYNVSYFLKTCLEVDFNRIYNHTNILRT